MKILVVDPDSFFVQKLCAKLEALGHSVSEEPARGNMMNRLAAESFDAIFMDPVPLATPRALVLSVRRMMKVYPYIFLLSETIPMKEGFQSGVNDFLSKPLDMGVLEEKIDNAGRLLALVSHMGDDSEDFPSAGGVIAKSALNQLFLSAIDRADRYGERSFMLTISLDNYKDIRDLDGPRVADYISAKLCQYLVLLRRQSDIIGQTGKNEYSLLLQRPQYEAEPLEAANRFAEALMKFKDMADMGSTGTPLPTLEMTVSLVSIPVGALLVSQSVKV